METRKQDDPRLQQDDDDVIVLPDVEEQDRIIDLRDPPPPPQSQATLAWGAPADPKARTYLWLLITVCVLNSIDAMLTNHVIARGLADEGNPIVSSLGLFPKLVLVPLAAEAVYLLKPKALWVPAVALFAVILYTAAGAVLSA
ncbi:MAG: hypothetical protein QOH26_1708 [Actinomycetota bacterium]|nr:hypothetical protein [Actinomycetota bacterium]